MTTNVKNKPYYLPECTFCQIVRGQSPATILAGYQDTMVIRPLNPVTSEHALVLPRLHISSMHEVDRLSGQVFFDATRYASERFPSFNLICSSGPYSTQTMMHLHVHVVPRREHDGLKLPWSE